MKKYTALFLGVIFSFVMTLSAQDQETIWNSNDEALLIQVIEKPGDAPQDILLKNVACKRLAVIGTDQAIPALTAMLPNEKLNLNARTALETMPGAAVDEALIASLSDLDGIALVGVIDTLAIRSVPAAAAPLADLLAKTENPAVKKAVFNAFGYIATEESIEALLAELNKERDPDYSVNAALSDGLLRAAAVSAKAGNTEKAAEICEAIASADLPQFDKNGGLYNALLYRGSAAAEKLSSILAKGNQNDFEVALKTVREYPDSDAEPIVKSILAVFPELAPERQILVIAALGDRSDEISKSIVLPFIIDLIKNGAPELLEAAVKASGKCGTLDPVAVYDALFLLYQTEHTPEFWDTLVAALVNLPDLGNKPAEAVAGKSSEALTQLSNSEKLALLAQMKVLELRRVSAAGPDLLAIANTEGIDPVIHDRAVAALSEIVSLQDLSLLVEALERETDTEKVDWNLRAACTRLPREDCAAEVVKMFQAADAEGKDKLISLLKQIGGQTALQAVVDAAGDPETANKATEILGQWNTPEDAPALAAACLKLAKESPKYRTRAIRAYIRIPRQFDIPVDQKIKMARVAFNTASRPEDKVLIFEIFKRIIDIESLKAVLEYTSEPDYCENACEAAVFIAEKIKETSPELQDAMRKVTAAANAQELKDRAAHVLERK